MTTTLLPTFTKSIIDNKQGLTPEELTIIKTFLATSFEISTSILSLITKYETYPITHITFLELILFLTNVVKNNSLLNEIKKKESVFLIIQFILFTLIDYDLIPIPESLKDELEELIEHSLNLLDTNLEIIENAIVETETSCIKYCKKSCCCM